MGQQFFPGLGLQDISNRLKLRIHDLLLACTGVTIFSVKFSVASSARGENCICSHLCNGHATAEKNAKMVTHAIFTVNWRRDNVKNSHRLCNQKKLLLCLPGLKTFLGMKRHTLKANKR